MSDQYPVLRDDRVRVVKIAGGDGAILRVVHERYSKTPVGESEFITLESRVGNSSGETTYTTVVGMSMTRAAEMLRDLANAIDAYTATLEGEK